MALAAAPIFCQGSLPPAPPHPLFCAGSLIIDFITHRPLAAEKIEFRA